MMRSFDQNNGDAELMSIVGKVVELNRDLYSCASCVSWADMIVFKESSIFTRLVDHYLSQEEYAA